MAPNCCVHGDKEGRGAPARPAAPARQDQPNKAQARLQHRLARFAKMHNVQHLRALQHLITVPQYAPRQGREQRDFKREFSSPRARFVHACAPDRGTCWSWRYGRGWRWSATQKWSHVCTGVHQVSTDLPCPSVAAAVRLGLPAHHFAGFPVEMLKSSYADLRMRPMDNEAEVGSKHRGTTDRACAIAGADPQDKTRSCHW